jgi:putative endonuclease
MIFEGVVLKPVFYVYILLLSNKQLYTGFTADLRRRLTEHKNGSVEFTWNKLPMELLHYEVYMVESDARRRERFLKTTEGKRLLKQQIRDILIKKNVLSIDWTESDR